MDSAWTGASVPTRRWKLLLVRASHDANGTSREAHTIDPHHEGKVTSETEAGALNLRLFRQGNSLWTENHGSNVRAADVSSSSGVLSLPSQNISAPPALKVRRDRTNCGGTAMKLLIMVPGGWTPLGSMKITGSSGAVVKFGTSPDVLEQPPNDGSSRDLVKIFYGSPTRMKCLSTSNNWFLEGGARFW